jgi:hypothetical protein
VLEGLGWKIYRVWSTDWYLHPKESKEKLLETVKGVVEQAKMQVKSEFEPQILSINEPSAWAEQANRSPADKLAGLPAQPFLPSSQPEDPLSPANWPADPLSVVESIESEVAENLEAEFVEVEPLAGISCEAEAEELYSGPPLELEEGQTDFSGEDFLPEMTSKAESLALLADENSRKKPVRRTGKSKLLKFNADPSSEKINTTELIPEPEPEKISFYQAYPEIDFSVGAEKKRRPKRLNEFEYIYGSERYFEPEPYPEEDNYTGTGWNSKPDIKPETELETELETESEIDTGLKFEAGSELRNLAEKKSEKLSEKNNPLEAAVPLYRACPSSEFSQFGDLSELSDAELEEAVIRIIEYEGPIHTEVLLQRIKVHTGVPRMLGKAKQRIIDAAASAESSAKVRIEGEFYWPASGPACLLRRRDGDASAKIEWICDEEIKEAVRFVLNSQYSTPLEDLIVQTSRVLGMKSTRKNTWERIEKLVQSGIESNELTLMPNEMIYFVE